MNISDIILEAYEYFRADLVAVTTCIKDDDRQTILECHRPGAEPAASWVEDISLIAGKAVKSAKIIRGKIPAREIAALSIMAIPFQMKNGKSWGSLCVVTRNQQRWSKGRRRSLALFARICASQIETEACRKNREILLQPETALSVNKSFVEKRFNDLARNVPGAIFEYSMRPGLPDTIEFMSPGCFDIWGYTAEELEGDPTRLWEAILEDDLADMRASVLHSAEALTRWQHRWRIRTKSGVIKWLQAYGSPSRLSDGGTSWNTLILDVSLEQTAQMTLVENTRLIHEAQKIHSIGRLSGGIAHDFNNILAVITGNAEGIDIEKLSDEDRESLEEIISASSRGAELTKQLLAFARRSEIKPTPLNLSSVLANMSTMLSRVLPTTISIETSLTAGLWAVNVDRSLLENAILNLAINARDAMPQGGALTIETANVRVDKDYVDSREEDIPPGRYVMVAVSDTGTGIEETLVPRVFEPFFTTKGPNEGTGLGLSMVDGFVRQSGGAVRVYSEVGHGTSVKLYFPATLTGSKVQLQPESRASRLQASTARILLVEDQDAVRRIIEKTLQSAGHKVVSASLADNAWDIFQQDPEGFDLIVTDVVMPGKLQGPQLVKAIRMIRRDIPALFMSGYPHEANVHGNGVRDTDISLMKPVRRGELLTAIDRLTRQI